MRVGSEDVIASQRPMLHFKKRTSRQRLLLNRIIGGNNPEYKGTKLRGSISLRAFIGNLVLLIHLRFRRSRIYLEALTRIFRLSLFNRFIKFCLYLDVNYLSLSFFNNMNRIRSRIKTLPYLFRSFRILRRMINDNIGREKANYNGLRFSDDMLNQWKKQFPEAVKHIISDAEESRKGMLKLFDSIYDVKKYGWNTSPDALTRYPAYFEPLMGLWFRKYCDFKKHGDAKYAFELNKHLFFTELALAYRLTKDKKYGIALYEYLKDWRKTAITDIGICWYGNVHVAQRMVSWILTGLILKFECSLGEMICDEIDKGLKEHACILKSRYRYPANNHKIGSLCALILCEIAGNSTEDNRRMSHYTRELELEVKRQVTEQGAPREGSVAYGRLVYEFLLLVNLFSVSIGFEVPETIYSRTKAMTHWFGSLLGPATAFPAIGDSSGECGFPFCGSIYQETDCLAVGGRTQGFNDMYSITPLAWLLLNSAGIGTSENTAYSSEEDTHFVDKTGGYARMSGKRETGLWTVWMRAGNYGLEPKFGHAHSDYLAPVVYLDGNAVLIERGTFKYNSYTEDRLSDVLTGGHSGIRYDVFEQNSWRGTFEWGRIPLSAGLDSYDKGLSGWMNMPDNAVLSRRICFSDRGLVITDRLTRSDYGEKLIEWSFIVDGVVLEDRIDRDGTVIFRLVSNPEKLIQFSHDGIIADDYELCSTRIATDYGVSHEGSQIVIRRLYKQSGTWTTRLKIFN